MSIIYIHNHLAVPWTNFDPGAWYLELTLLRQGSGEVPGKSRYVVKQAWFQGGALSPRVTCGWEPDLCLTAALPLPLNTSAVTRFAP